MASSKLSVSTGTCDFTFDVYKHVTRTNQSENVFMSTTSIAVVLAMIQLGARGDTEAQISEVLRMGKLDRKQLAEEMEVFVNTLNTKRSSVTLETANGLFPNNTNAVSNDYIQLVANHFKASVTMMDFIAKTEECRQEINKWVEDKTNSKIKDLLPSGSVNELTAMVVVNAIYFKGSWEEKFKEGSTSKADFYIDPTNKVQVNMMRKKFDKLLYARIKEFDCQAIEIPYVGCETGMLVLLPNSKDGLSTLENSITSTNLKSITKQMYKTEVRVNIPKFKLETSYKMKEILSELGMPDLFDTKKADLSGIGQDLSVSEVFHKAFVDVNEEGTEAAAATGAVIMLMCARQETTFIADHPFMFLIWDHKLDVPLFIGRLVNPTVN